MSQQDYRGAIDSLFSKLSDEENLDIYNEINESELIPESTKDAAEYVDVPTEDQDDKLEENMIVSEPKVSKLVNLPVHKNIFKESAEPNDMFETRLKIVNLLKNIQYDGRYLDPDSVNVLSRIINNKYWYNMKYDKSTEENISHIMEIITRVKL